MRIKDLQAAADAGKHVEIKPDGTAIISDTKPRPTIKQVLAEIDDEPRAIQDRKIIVTFVHPPIPDRRFDWRAHWDDENEDGDHGEGRTPEEAVRDLLSANTPQRLSNTEILCFIVGWQGGTLHQLAEKLGVSTNEILHADYDQMQDLMRLAQKQSGNALNHDLLTVLRKAWKAIAADLGRIRSAATISLLSEMDVVISKAKRE
ncbi:MAG TPA: hypothetical protein VHZ28_01255, partial [Terracidiphilus sp.]|nr:hypothetical protein [Terracidiphilus sp.]